MTGGGNHNYGKTFSEETKKKMSVSIRDAKGGVSDEVIIKVRHLLKEGHKNIDIQKVEEIQEINKLYYIIYIIYIS